MNRRRNLLRAMCAAAGGVVKKLAPDADQLVQWLTGIDEDRRYAIDKANLDIPLLTPQYVSNQVAVSNGADTTPTSSISFPDVSPFIRSEDYSVTVFVVITSIAAGGGLQTIFTSSTNASNRLVLGLASSRISGAIYDGSSYIQRKASLSTLSSNTPYKVTYSWNAESRTSTLVINDAIQQNSATVSLSAASTLGTTLFQSTALSDARVFAGVLALVQAEKGSVPIIDCTLGEGDLDVAYNRVDTSANGILTDVVWGTHDWTPANNNGTGFDVYDVAAVDSRITFPTYFNDAFAAVSMQADDYMRNSFQDNNPADLFADSFECARRNNLTLSTALISGRQDEESIRIINEWMASGVVDVGGHGVTSIDPALYTEEIIDEEIFGCRDWMIANLNLPQINQYRGAQKLPVWVQPFGIHQVPDELQDYRSQALGDANYLLDRDVGDGIAGVPHQMPVWDASWGYYALHVISSTGDSLGLINNIVNPEYDQQGFAQMLGHPAYITDPQPYTVGSDWDQIMAVADSKPSSWRAGYNHMAMYQYIATQATKRITVDEQATFTNIEVSINPNDRYRYGLGCSVTYRYDMSGSPIVGQTLVVSQEHENGATEEIPENNLHFDNGSGWRVDGTDLLISCAFNEYSDSFRLNVRQV